MQVKSDWMNLPDEARPTAKALNDLLPRTEYGTFVGWLVEAREQELVDTSEYYLLLRSMQGRLSGRQRRQFDILEQYTGTDVPVDDLDAAVQYFINQRACSIAIELLFGVKPEEVDWVGVIRLVYDHLCRRQDPRWIKVVAANLSWQAQPPRAGLVQKVGDEWWVIREPAGQQLVNWVLG